MQLCQSTGNAIPTTEFNGYEIPRSEDINGAISACNICRIVLNKIHGAHMYTTSIAKIQHVSKECKLYLFNIGSFEVV